MKTGNQFVNEYEEDLSFGWLSLPRDINLVKGH